LRVLTQIICVVIARGKYSQLQAFHECYFMFT
jgi:hypothetical protein